MTMIRQNFCPKCQQITSQKTTKSLSSILTTCQQCHKAIDLVFRTRKPSQSVKARKISFIDTKSIAKRTSEKPNPPKVSWLAKAPLRKVSAKQAKRNRELAKIPPPIDGKCENCGEVGDWRGLSKHHLVHRSQGGKDNRENLLWCCYRCHNAFHGIIEQHK